ncbi:MAG: hypothetical protein KJ955_03525 [Nanoarchaeota archaeon]|nr:hypothetical protein [Nanoarchaeota archaeon]
MKKQAKKPAPKKAAAKKICKQAVRSSRLPSGVPGFDKLVQGGFKENSINLIVGGPGSGKTIFAMMFLVEGFKKGEPGIYVTFEERKEKLFSDMCSFGWDLEIYEKKGLFTYLEYTPEQVRRVLVEGGGEIDSLITKTKAKRLALDSVSSFSLLYKEELAKKEAALALFEMIDKWGCTAVLTAQDTSFNSTEVSSALEFEVDSIILLYHDKKNGVRIRGLEILKMRGTKTPNVTYSINLDKNGISVLSKKMS